MPRTQAEAAAAFAFEQMLGRLSHHEPRDGWADVKQLAELSDADLGVILAAEPDLLRDAMDEHTVATIADFLQRDGLGIERLARVGALIVIMLRAPARRLLLHELRCFCDREGLEQHGCVTAADAGVPAAGPI